MKVYIATSFPNWKQAADFAARLEKNGVEITQKWWMSETQEFPTARPPNVRNEVLLPFEEQLRYAKADLEGVYDADVVWVIVPGPSGGTGCWIEMGYALALRDVGLENNRGPQPELIISGPPRTIFATKAQAAFRKHEEAFDWIRHKAQEVNSNG